MNKATTLGVVFGFGLWLMSALSASAQGQNCAERQAVIDRLAEGYGESRQMLGLGAANRVFEVFASTETGTWTITLTHPNGVTCMVASGQAFELVQEELLDDPT